MRRDFAWNAMKPNQTLWPQSYRHCRVSRQLSSALHTLVMSRNPVRICRNIDYSHLERTKRPLWVVASQSPLHLKRGRCRTAATEHSPHRARDLFRPCKDEQKPFHNVSFHNVSGCTVPEHQAEKNLRLAEAKKNPKKNLATSAQLEHRSIETMFHYENKGGGEMNCAF